MEEADEEQPHVAAEENVGDLVTPAAALGAICQQDGACAEEHAEHGAHLALGENPAKHPEGGVDLGVRASEDRQQRSERNEVVHVGHREIRDVHDEDAHERGAAQDVEGVDALLAGDGRKLRLLVRRPGQLFRGCGRDRCFVERNAGGGHGGLLLLSCQGCVRAKSITGARRCTAVTRWRRNLFRGMRAVSCEDGLSAQHRLQATG